MAGYADSNPISQLIRFCRESVSDGSISDIHIDENERPWIRQNDRPYELEWAEITEESIRGFLDSVLSPMNAKKFEQKYSVSCGIAKLEFGDIRIHVMRQSGKIAIIIRLLRATVPTLDGLFLPDIIRTWADTANGLYLFTGPTGMGKSTSMAALINEINTYQERVIYTVEDPIEYRHKPKKSKIRQLNIGQDVDTYHEAVISLLRADPDVILLGELRDPETILAALNAAETGHLVFATLHDSSAQETINRILGSFSGDRQGQVRQSFGSVFRGTCAQRLLPRASGEGRIIATEILTNKGPGVIAQLKDEKTNSDQIRSALSQNQKYGMHTLEWDLNRLHKEGEITFETAIEYANKPEEIKK